MRTLLSVDLDGTLLTNAWPALGTWNPGAIATIKKLLKHMDVTVFTARISPVDFGSEIPRDPFLVQKEIDSVRELLDAAGLYEVSIWQKPYKPPAFAFVDDRGVFYNGRKGAWDALYTKLMLLAGLEPEEEAHPLYIPELDDVGQPWLRTHDAHLDPGLGEAAMYRQLLAESADTFYDEEEAGAHRSYGG